MHCFKEGNLIKDVHLLGNPRDPGNHGTMWLNAMSPKLITTLKTLVELSGGDDPMTKENFPDLIALLSGQQT